VFDVYKRKFIDQPFPRKHIGSFNTIDEVMRRVGLSPEEIIEGLTAVTETGYQIEQTYSFLGEGKDQIEIAEILGISQSAVSQFLKNAIKKMKSNETLKRTLQEKARYSNRNCEIVISERISVMM
jgi:DNA-binding CsgD family transcriptional regulator